MTDKTTQQKFRLFADLQVDARPQLQAIPRLGRLQRGAQGQRQASADRDLQSGLADHEQAEQTQIDRQGVGQDDYEEVAEITWTRLMIA